MYDIFNIALNIALGARAEAQKLYNKRVFELYANQYDRFIGDIGD